ncbi:MAG: prolipoprotein diacylglyceryl transferase [Gemmatimonadales bacterium]|nr:MAG: prolipoprotein diacylglyceryl transferase [Gemmatimonadales bacterium]
MLPHLFRFPEWLPLVGGEYVTSFGVMMFLSFVTAGLILRAEMERNGFDGEKAWDLIFMAVIGGIVGGKLYYVFLNFDRLQAEGLSFLLSRGGMVWYGGFAVAAFLVLWQAKRMGLPLLKICDSSAPALALAYAVGRVGCFLVGDDWGRPTDSWVGVRFSPPAYPPSTVENIESFGISVDPALIERYGSVIPVHPTQLYEVAMSTVIFLFLWKIRGRSASPGWLFSVWLALAGAERFVVEFFRAKDDRFFGALTLAQVISIGLIAFALVWMARLRKTPDTPAG